MASIFETFPADEICAINEAVVETNAKKATDFGLSVPLVDIIFMLNLQQNRNI